MYAWSKSSQKICGLKSHSTLSDGWESGRSPISIRGGTGGYKSYRSANTSYMIDASACVYSLQYPHGQVTIIPNRHLWRILYCNFSTFLTKENRGIMNLQINCVVALPSLGSSPITTATLPQPNQAYSDILQIPAKGHVYLTNDPRLLLRDQVLASEFGLQATGKPVELPNLHDSSIMQDTSSLGYK